MHDERMQQRNERMQQLSEKVRDQAITLAARWQICVDGVDQMDADYYGTVSDISGEPLPSWRVGHFVDTIMQAMQGLCTYLYGYAEQLIEDYGSEEWYAGQLFFKDGTEYFGDAAA